MEQKNEPPTEVPNLEWVMRQKNWNPAKGDRVVVTRDEDRASWLGTIISIISNYTRNGHSLFMVEPDDEREVNGYQFVTRVEMPLPATVLLAEDAAAARSRKQYAERFSQDE